MFTKIHGRTNSHQRKTKYTTDFISVILTSDRPLLRRLSAAYTLVEVMIMVLLLAALAALLLPIMQSGKDTAKLAVCTMNMKQIYNAVMSQAVQNQQTFLSDIDPYKWEVYAEALVESDVMICPMESDDPHFKKQGNYIFLNEPPSSMEQGALESDSHLFVFREQAAMKLTSDLQAQTELGRYGRDGDYCEHTPNGVITGGKYVDVFYFSYDPATTENLGGEGEMWFGGDLVLGVIGRTTDLDATDATLGVEGMTYFTGGCRGLSNCSSSTYADSIEITPYRRTLKHTFSYASLSCKDDFRVITDIGAGSSYGINVEAAAPSGVPQQIFLADTHIPWVNFTNGVDSNGVYNFSETIDARHFGKVNTVNREGAVELLEIEELLPDSKRWRRR